MDIEFTGNGEVQILMKDYILEALEMFPEDCTGKAVTPARNHLFKVDPTMTKLSEERRALLHSITAKLLFVSKRARPDSHLLSHLARDQGGRRRLGKAVATSDVSTWDN